MRCNQRLNKLFAVSITVCLSILLEAPSCGQQYADDAVRGAGRVVRPYADDGARTLARQFARSPEQIVASDLQSLSAREGVSIDVRQVQAVSNNVKFLVLHRKAEKAYTIVASCQTGIESGDITEEISLELVKLENAVSEVCARIASEQYVQ